MLRPKIRLKSSITNAFPIELSGKVCIAINCMLILLCQERVYSPGLSSGAMSRYVYVACIVVGVAIALSKATVVEYRLADFGMLLCVAVFLFWSYDERAWLYSVIVLSLFFLSKVYAVDMSLGCRLLVLFGLSCSLLFCYGDERWSGFLNTSAPCFGLIMLVLMTYLLFSGRSSRFDIALAFVSFALIIMTQTRAAQLVGVILLVARFGNTAASRIALFFHSHRFLMVVTFIALAAAIALNYEWVLDLVGREGGEDSNRTRLLLMEGALSQWLSGSGTFLFGNGGGYAMAYTAATNSAFSGNLPVHQDVLMLLCDYGVVGFGLLIASLYPTLKRWPWYCLLVLAMAAFHNIFTTGATLIVLFVVFQSLAGERLSGPGDVKR